MKSQRTTWVGGGLILLTAMVFALGCADRTSMFPNNDPALRKKFSQFKADATKRVYPASAPSGGEAVARAEVEYFLKNVNIVNISDEDWKGVELWVNRSYVCYIPAMPKGRQESIFFKMLVDAKGQFFPLNIARVQTIELYRDGKLYNVPVHLAD